MRTNIVLDEKLVERAFHFAPVKTKRDLIDLALREYVQNHARSNIFDLVGQIKICEDYDYKKLRKEKEE